MTTDCSAARASGLVGSKPFGAAFSGEDFTASTSTPILSSRPAKFGYWMRTPIEPVSAVSGAKMRSAPSAVR